MANLRKIQLGAFPAGEIPAPIEHQYLTYAREVIDISGWTVLGFFIEGPDGPHITVGPPAITDGPNGKVTYIWGPDDMQVSGEYSGLIWVQDTSTNPNLRLGSDLFVWSVKDGPGPTPPETP